MSEVIRKSMTLLTAIRPNEDKEEWSATEISRELNIPVQTVHRLLLALEEYGFVFQNKETKKFRLGLTLLQLGLSIRNSLSVRNSALPFMKRLADQTKEKVCLTVPEGDEGVLIDCMSAQQLWKDADSIGLRLPLCEGASKKVILAYMDRGARQRVIRSLIEKGEIEDIQRLEEDLTMIRKCGVAISFGEMIEQTISVAAPIFSWEEKVVASISIVGPENRCTENYVNQLIHFTQKAAEDISEELGWLCRK